MYIIDLNYINNIFSIYIDNRYIFIPDTRYTWYKYLLYYNYK